ncbi:MAG: class IV adenylate cyclase [Elusimicrobiaceae bacterium]|jgi:predicted adenylyl cyclase CyaB
MKCLNIEIKARCDNADFIRSVLLENKAEFKGVDTQTDTYFNAQNGRLKLRSGNIENALIHYVRKNQAGPKASEVTLFRTDKSGELRILLSGALGVKVEVKKKREIYFIGNVKFHIDKVSKLGSFVEIEAIANSGKIKKEALLRQCCYYLKLFKIPKKNMLTESYSDMLLKVI